MLSKDKSCKVRIVPDNLLQSSLGFGLKKDLPILPLFDKAILSYRDKELLVVLQKKWFPDVCEPQFFVTQQKQLTIIEFSGLVFVLIITILFSFLLLIPEILYYKYFQNKLTDWMKSRFRTTRKKMFNLSSSKL